MLFIIGSYFPDAHRRVQLDLIAAAKSLFQSAWADFTSGIDRAMISIPVLNSNAKPNV